MATRSRKKYSSNSGFQRVSLRNGDIPGRKAKPYHVSYYSFQETPGRIMYRHVNTGWEPVVGDRIMVGTDVNRFPESADYLFDPFGLPNAETVSDNASAKIHAKVQKARDFGFNAAVFIAELPAAMKMFATTATRITRAYSQIKRGNLRGAERALKVKRSRKVYPSWTSVQKDWASYWLELKYGWMPYLSDMYSAAHKVAHELHQPPIRSVRAASSIIAADETVLASGARLQREWSVGCQIGLSFTVQNEMIAHAASLGFTNPMLIAWETVPLSFVVDWFIPVGDWLQQFSSFHGLSFVDGWSSRKGSLTSTYSYPSGSSSGTRAYHYYDENQVLQVRFDPEWAEEYTGSTIVVKESGFHRQTLSSFPGRTAPRLQFGTSLPRLVTALSLVRQRM